ncbi:hypothetical protein [Brevibacillus sp. NRS-1366]
MNEVKPNNIDSILSKLYGRSSGKSYYEYDGDAEYEDFNDYVEYIYDKRN